MYAVEYSDQMLGAGIEMSSRQIARTRCVRSGRASAALGLSGKFVLLIAWLMVVLSGYLGSLKTDAQGPPEFVAPIVVSECTFPTTYCVLGLIHDNM